MSLKTGATRDLARSLQKPHHSLFPQGLNLWHMHRQLMGPNTFNLFCTLEIVFALIAVITLFQAAPRISAQSLSTAPWYLVIVIFALIAHAALLMFNGIRREFTPALVQPTIYISYAAYILWPLASHSSSTSLPWSWLIGLYGLLAPLCLSKAQHTIAHIVALSVSLAASETAATLINGITMSYKDILADVFYFGALATLLGGIVSLAMASAMYADTVYTDTMSAHLRFNRSRDHAKELQEFDKLVHDNVMAALLDASRFEGEIAERTRTLAQRALRVLDEENFKETPNRPITFQALTEQVATGVYPWNARLRFVTEPDGSYPKADPDSSIPQEVARAFTHAVTEAVSNSARHSDSRITQISIHTEMRPPQKGGRSAKPRPYIFCRVSDKGRGFNVKALDMRRMGVRVSMLRSMEEVGGKVTIKSAPEGGTTVLVQWPNEEPDAG